MISRWPVVLPLAFPSRRISRLASPLETNQRSSCLGLRMLSLYKKKKNQIHTSFRHCLLPSLKRQFVDATLRPGSKLETLLRLQTANSSRTRSWADKSCQGLRVWKASSTENWIPEEEKLQSCEQRKLLLLRMEWLWLQPGFGGIKHQHWDQTPACFAQWVQSNPSLSARGVLEKTPDEWEAQIKRTCSDLLAY